MFDLREYLRTQVNGKISEKMKSQNQHQETYFRLRNDIETKVISETDFYTLFENVPLTELQNQKLDERTRMLVTIKALRDYADMNDTENPKCVYLHALYLKLKKQLSFVVPFESSEDGFIDYLKLKPQREEIETARFSGSVCIFCGSDKVTSYGSMWKCSNCGRTFRKHKA